MGRVYTAIIDALAVAAIEEIFFIAAPADAVVVIHEIVITQDTSETSEQLPLNIFRTATDQAAKGAAATARPMQVGDAAFGGTVRTGIVAADTLAEETTPMFRQAQNQLNGWHILWTPETRPVLSPSGRLVIKIDVAPSAALAVSGYVTFEELGG